jgi:hypothetical protein
MSCGQKMRQTRLRPQKRSKTDFTERYLSKYQMVIQVHYATIMKRNKVVAEATNKYGTRSRGAGFWDRSMHAEVAVVKRLGDISQLRDATLIVVRYLKNGDYCGSKPCPKCQVFLEKCMEVYGLRKVIYS